MNEKELRTHAVCSICKRKILHAGLPLFWKVTIERYVIDMQAAQRQQGLGMMLGAQLAMAMGPDEEMATPVMEPAILSVCETCAVSTDQTMPCFAMLAELASKT